MKQYSKFLSVNKMKIVLFLTVVCFLLKDAIETQGDASMSLQKKSKNTSSLSTLPDFFMRINRNNEQHSMSGVDDDAFRRLQEKRKYTATHPDAFQRLQKMKMNRAKWFKDEPYVEEILTNQ